MEIKFTQNHKGRDSLNLVVELRQLWDLADKISELLETDHESFNLAFVGEASLSTHHADYFGVEFRDLPTKARRLIRLAEQHPGIGRGRLMQKLAARAEEFDELVLGLKERNLLSIVLDSSGRGPTAQRFFSLRDGAPGSQRRLKLKSEEPEESELEVGALGAEVSSDLVSNEKVSDFSLSSPVESDETSGLVWSEGELELQIRQRVSGLLDQLTEADQESLVRALVSSVDPGNLVLVSQLQAYQIQDKEVRFWRVVGPEGDVVWDQPHETPEPHPVSETTDLSKTSGE